VCVLAGLKFILVLKRALFSAYFPEGLGPPSHAVQLRKTATVSLDVCHHLPSRAFWASDVDLFSMGSCKDAHTAFHINPWSFS